MEAAYAINDTLNITVVMNDLATDFRRIGAFDEAAPYHYLALQIAEQYRGPDVILNERNMASAYNGIGSICREMNENEEAVRVYRLALELEKRHNNYRGMAINYANIGAVHFDRGEYAEAEENYVVSLENNEKAGLPTSGTGSTPVSRWPTYTSRRVISIRRAGILPTDCGRRVRSTL